MALGLQEWAIRCYTKAMNLCGWNEEMYISSKEVYACMRRLNYPWSRQISILLHGMYQNPYRLEMLTIALRYLRQDPMNLKKYGHLLCSIAAFYTHNVFPKEQKLFIDKYDHEFGFWHELAIVCYHVPLYFELGCFAAKKALESNYLSELPQNAQESLRNQAEANFKEYQFKLDSWLDSMLPQTPVITKYLMTKAHEAFSQQDYYKAQLF